MAIALLIVAAFGGLSVGIPLTIELFAGPVTTDLAGFVLLILAYGLVSLAGVVALLLRWRRVTLLIALLEGLVAVALLAFYAGVTADWSLLIVAAISGGAALFELADIRLARARVP